jgi:SHAQKYF class myb-like DNA-binding protein
MFRVNSNTNKEKPTKKKLLFISTIISNNNNEHKSFDTTHPKYPSTNITTSTPPSLKNSQNPDKAKRELRNLNKIRNKLKPKIFFKLYRVNVSDKEKEIKKQKAKKEAIIKKKLKFNYKQKQIFSKKGLNKNFVSGRWLIDEHQRFIDGIIKYGNNWRLVQKYVGTRSGTQTRSHAQKFFEKLRRSKIFKTEKYDFTKNSLKLLHDIMSTLSEEEYEQTLKKIHLLTYRNDNKLDNDNIDINGDKEKNNNLLSDNIKPKENDFNHEEDIEKIKFNNNEFSYIETINDKLYNNNDYLAYNYNNVNNNNNNLNFEIRSRKGSEIFKNKRKVSICEIKSEEEIIDCIDEYNNLNANLENNEDKTLNNPSNDADYSFSQEMSRKMSLDEKLIASVY